MHTLKGDMQQNQMALKSTTANIENKQRRGEEI